MAKPKGGLTAWFGKGPKGDWVDISAPKRMVDFKRVVDLVLKVEVKESTQNVYQGPQLTE